MTGDQELSASLRRRGVLILALFGLAWAAAAGGGIGGAAFPVIGVAAIVVTAAVIVLGMRPGPPPRPRRLPDRWNRGVGLVNLAQAAAIVAAVVGLRAAGVPVLIPPVVCLVVGLHFLPLARLFDQRQYQWTGVALCVVGVIGIIGIAVGGGLSTALTVVGIGAAVVLWTTSVHVAVRG